MKIKYVCKLCNKEFEGGRCFTSHLRSHNYTSKQYYDEFIKTEKVYTSKELKELGILK